MAKTKYYRNTLVSGGLAHASLEHEFRESVFVYLTGVPYSLNPSRLEHAAWPVTAHLKRNKGRQVGVPE